MTVILLTCSYKGAEFIRVGYYVNTDYGDPEMRENPPQQVILEQVSFPHKNEGKDFLVTPPCINNS